MGAGTMKMTPKIGVQQNQFNRGRAFPQNVLRSLAGYFTEGTVLRTSLPRLLEVVRVLTPRRYSFFRKINQIIAPHFGFLSLPQSLLDDLDQKQC